MINPSIESSDFLFWHEKIWSRIFENFVGNRQSTFHEFKFSVCVYTHPKFQNMKFSLSVFDKIFKNPTQNFFNAKIENQSFRLMGYHVCTTFNFRCEKAAKVFCKMSQKVYPERPFEFRLSI